MTDIVDVNIFRRRRLVLQFRVGMILLLLNNINPLASLEQLMGRQ